MIFLKRGFSVCSSRTYRARRTARPELIMVANCRAKTALSRTLMRLLFSSMVLRSGMPRFSSRLTTVKPLRRSSATTAALESPISFTGEEGPALLLGCVGESSHSAPAPRLTRRAEILLCIIYRSPGATAVASRGRVRAASPPRPRASVSGRTRQQQALQLIGHRRPLERQFPGDVAALAPGRPGRSSSSACRAGRRSA